ncbi:MAG TPA: HAMP domain-containing histidine kinase [Candidatus Lachnoclostridium stercorigallinarum]|uniref:histidine kinase n=1 Tax=Candidatus Lachnoclostridium stercorigallinarum TaxID=2838634 RepID=A0A9D2GJH1_9FIRM|nr:HAMP domain-containing histidine kinase [Candidatus Lachnoclostridium stercorigallinarum]
MRLHSLYAKFLLGYLVFGLLGFITISTFSSELIYNYLLEKKYDSLYSAANLIASRYSEMYRGVNEDTAEETPQMEAAASFLDADIWVIDRQGVLVLDTCGEYEAGTSIPGFDPASGKEPYMAGNYYGMFDQDMLSVSAPITGNYNTYGYVLVHMPLSQIQNMLTGLLNLTYITAAVIYALSLILLLVFTKIVYIPLVKIREGANEYAAGNLDYKIQVDSQDEMGYLSATLNYMSGELNKMEEYQRTFVANVSHDFRSPLTSIKGYLEAIIDGTIPPEMQEKYLKRVISETERLNKLTQSMLTLNSLDSKGYLSRSNFDINRVIKDTAASFEGTCSSRGITFDLTFSASTEMVYADLGKIQQVLYNLIDNAIKFSHDNSVIYIQESVRHEKVFVSVKDTGIGIPKDNLKKIWERFYKSDLSRGKDKKGTGLGLSIVREIIQAHGENIDVISTEGVGTEFIFTLPKASNL